MHGDDGLAGPGAAGDAHGAVGAPVHEGALLGVEEELPLGEGEALDRPAQVLVGLEPGELGSGGAPAQARDDVGVGGDGGDVLRAQELEVLAHVVDRRPRRQGEEGLPLPGDSGGDGQIQELGLAGGGERRGTEPDVDAEFVAQSLDGQPLGPGERVIAAGSRDGAGHGPRVLAARLGVGALDAGGLAGDLLRLPSGRVELGPRSAPRLLDGAGVLLDGVLNAGDLGGPVVGVDADGDGLGDPVGLVVRPDAMDDVDGLAARVQLEQDRPVEVGDAGGAHAPVGGAPDVLQVQAGARGHGAELGDEGADLRLQRRVPGGGVLGLAAGPDDRGHVSVLPGARRSGQWSVRGRPRGRRRASRRRRAPRRRPPSGRRRRRHVDPAMTGRS